MKRILLIAQNLTQLGYFEQLQPLGNENRETG